MSVRRSATCFLVAAGLLVVASGCTSSPEETTPVSVTVTAPTEATSVTTVSADTTAQPVPTEPVRIMPLGDSITEQSPYRAALLTMLDEGSCSYDFVGSMLDVSFVDGRDPDHEGHGGWAADQIVNEALGWAEASQPEIVLLHIGTNDFYRGETVESTVDDVRRIIEQLRLGAPEVTVLLGQIIPGVALDDTVAEYNLALASLALELDSADSPVTAVDIARGFDWQFDTIDEVHPTEAGGKKIATRWYATLAQLPQLGCTP